MAAFFGKDLIFEMQSRDTCAFIFTNGTNDIQCIAVAGIGICNNRE